MVVTNLVQLAVYGQVLTSSGSQKKIVNVFNYYKGSGLDWPPDRSTFAAAFDATVWQTIRGVLPVEWVGQKYTVFFPEIAGDLPTLAGVPSSGTVTGGRLPLNQVVFVQTRSGERGKNWNGSKRWGPVAISQVAADELSPAALTAWNTAMGVLPQGLVVFLAHGANTYLPFIWSRTLTGPDPTTAPIQGALLTGFAVTHTLCEWRHRKERTHR